MSDAQKEPPKGRLYEFKLEKQYRHAKRVFNYQVPAYSRDEALVKIGQTFSDPNDEYKLTVLEG